MTLEKAIEEQEEFLRDNPHVEVLPWGKGIRLGIEALIVLQKERRDLISYAGELLPGETE